MTYFDFRVRCVLSALAGDESHLLLDLVDHAHVWICFPVLVLLHAFCTWRLVARALRGD
jgi:hypothetical protein